MKDLYNERINTILKNNQNCIMEIVDYKNANNIKVKFHDKYGAIVTSKYEHFIKGNVKNPYYPTVYNIGITGNKYKTYMNGKNTKEYDAWRGIIQRSYDILWKNKWNTYKDVTCSEEWLLYENFYEWIINEPNYEIWKNNARFCVDKDILNKGNKIYSKENCVLVSPRVNALFTKADSTRGVLPIGVLYNKRDDCYISSVDLDGKNMYLGKYNTIQDAFNTYKNYKEAIIKKVAIDEYSIGNISKKCCDAMLKYEVDITD